MRNYILFSLFIFGFGMYSQNQTDAQGRKQGFWKKMDEKDPKVRVYEGTFKDGKPVGVFKYFYSFDSVKVIMNFKPDGKTAYAKWFFPNGKPESTGKYVGEEKRDSVWLFFDEEGHTLSKEVYKDGKKDGPYIIYLPDGAVAEQKIYKNDILEGPFKQFFDGKIVKGEGVYVNGGLEGKVSYYFPNGVPVATGYYKNGNKVGPWIYRKENGKVSETELYKDGHLCDEKTTKAFFEKTKIKDEYPVKEEKKTQGGKPEQKKSTEQKPKSTTPSKK